MSRRKGVLAVLAVLCLGLFAYGCGGDDGASQDELDAARAEGAKEARDQAKLNQLQRQINQLQKQKSRGSDQNVGTQSQSSGSGSSSAAGPVSSCGDGVQVGPNTSCSFAMNVAGEKGSNPGASTITAYSPVTGQQYTMSCGSWSGGGTVCSGGNGATVYLP
ncbi:MAG: hypothetical protein J0H98_02585 [Solirubrobacterales bacterium]|nr:hypothetical protein [Solirubrobacterales bacterium]